MTRDLENFTKSGRSLTVTAPPRALGRTMTIRTQEESLLCGFRVLSATYTPGTVLSTGNPHDSLSGNGGPPLGSEAGKPQPRLHLTQSHTAGHWDSESTPGQPEASSSSDPLSCLLPTMFGVQSPAHCTLCGVLLTSMFQSLAQSHPCTYLVNEHVSQPGNHPFCEILNIPSRKQFRW